MDLLSGMNPAGPVLAKASGTVAKAGSAGSAAAGLTKTGTFWAGTGWKLGLGLGLGPWGPLLLTALGTGLIYYATPALTQAAAKSRYRRRTK